MVRAVSRPPEEHRSMIETSIVISLVVIFTFYRWVTR
jgi:hypothetical protein